MNFNWSLCCQGGCRRRVVERGVGVRGVGGGMSILKHNLSTRVLRKPVAGSDPLNLHVADIFFSFPTLIGPEGDR